MAYDKMSREELIEEIIKLKKDVRIGFQQFGSNQKWEQIFDALPDLIAIIDVNHEIIRINKSMADRLEVESDDLVTNKCFSLIHGTDEPPDFCPHKELLEDMKSHANEFSIKSLQGDFIVSVSPIFDEYGHLKGSVHVAHDITRRKKMEKELKESEKKYREVFNNANDMISLNIIKDNGLPGNFIDVNKIGIERLGYSLDEFLSLSPVELVVPEKRSEMPQNALKLSEKGYVEFEIIHETKDGRHIPVEVNNHLFDLNGEKVALAITRDITERKKAELDLKKSEEKFREVFNNANDSMFLHKLEDNKPGKFLEVNDMACQSLGYSRKELYKMYPSDIDTPESIDQIPKQIENLFKKGKTTFEAVHVSKDGEFLPVEINAHIFTIRGEKYILSIARDVRERKKTEDALKKSEIKYRTIFENVQDVFYQTDKNGNIIEISPSIERYSGYKSSELRGKSVETVYLNHEDRKDLLKALAVNGEVVDYELLLKTKDDNILYVSTNAHFLYDSSNNPVGIEGSLRDISERKNIEIELKKSLIEKEMLLKEIHHRVKNNLMIISSLLNIQSRYIKDQESKEIFKESQNRAKSMALIHERLYQSTDLKRIDFGDYINSLSSELFQTYVADPSLIDLKINVEYIYLDINTAIPLGLIVNELITNSLKHAFPRGMIGEIVVDFHKVKDHYEFIVKDNGIGFPDTIDYKNTESMGMQMVISLTEQIDGEIELHKEIGTTFKITFNETKII